MSEHNIVGFDEEQMKIIQSYRRDEARMKAEIEKLRGELNQSVYLLDKARLERDTAEKREQDETAKLREQIATLKARLHEAVFLKAGDKVGFDWAVLDRMAKQEEEIARLKKQFQKCRDYLKEALILNPTDNWQWGYRAAVLGMADSLLFDEPKPPKEPTP